MLRPLFIALIMGDLVISSNSFSITSVPYPNRFPLSSDCTMSFSLTISPLLVFIIYKPFLDNPSNFLEIIYFVSSVTWTWSDITSHISNIFSKEVCSTST